ncbi:MAG: ATP synthase F1 subunit delta [Pyrinomonadaceae bacterium]
MSVETVARRYANALADVVTKSNETENVKAELKIWESVINENANLRDVFGNPAIQQEQKENVLESLIGKMKPMRTTANFLRVLLRNGRLTELKEINEKFESVLEERAGIVSAKITSARPLGENEKRELQANLEKMTGKRVNLNFDVKQEIIGGVITTIGSTVYDGSVKTQLQNLKEQMMKN